MTSVFIEPNDIVFFRDDLPFGATGMQVGRCQFPPRPSVVAGALRSKVLAGHRIDPDDFRDDRGLPPAIREQIGHGRAAGDRPALAQGTFVLAGLHLGRRANGTDAVHYRVGRDLVVPDVKSPGGASLAPPSRLLAPEPSRRVPGSSSVAPLAPLTIAPGFKPADGWLAENDYVRYLAGAAPDGRVAGLGAVLDWEHRVGIAMGIETRTVDEGRLFSSRGAVLRSGWGLVAEVGGCTLLPASGLVRLGGDGRMARLSPWTARPTDWSAVRDAVARSRRFRLVVQTPAIFTSPATGRAAVPTPPFPEGSTAGRQGTDAPAPNPRHGTTDGWRPAAVRAEADGFVLEQGGFKARLVAAAVGAPELAGGWDLVRRAPKPFRLAAPAGSVYWFELIEGDGGAVWDALHGTSISDERQNEGFGLVHVGGWAHV